ADRLVIGGRTYQGDGIQLITVLPASGVRPAMMILAGTGSLGVAEINARMEGAAVPLLVVDRFGTLARGRWNGDRAELGPDARRIPWRTVETRAGRGGVIAATYQFPAQLPATADDDQVIAAGNRGIQHALARLGIADPPPVTFYVYPDPASKKSITGNGGAGHAIPSARVLHVFRADSAPGGDMEHLIAHESTHVFTRAAWGAPGSILFGEGVAVWASGTYAGKTLEQWRPSVKRRPILDLLGPGALRVPEPELYPLAGLFVEAVVRTVGLAHLPALFGATAADWPAACKAAGTTPEALEQALTAVLAP
ncbi:MAG TPA: hypothetical protein VL172_14015, partial [Kofleriaceae bacterium]|nr:hypothetical protein [Kofleriaceae bacterium]